MKKLIFFALFVFTALFFSTHNSYAVYDPLSVPNNKIGVHILFTSELSQARELVNSNGGDWGYVTIPIQAGDKDLKKWQKFMDDAKELHLIPMIRLATELNYFDNKTWKKPKEEDVIDFANFLDSLSWHTKNRYIIVFNEVNRADEWEGQADPNEYAQILFFAISAFKSKSGDYFIISSGMDNASETDGENYNQFDYFELMEVNVPGIFSRIDGIGSHSYPNPAFSQPPDITTDKSITSFLYESSFIEKLTQKSLPIFITETNWDQNVFTDDEIGNFFEEAIGGTWNDQRIVAITPFLLMSHGDQFKNFSFINKNGEKNQIFKKIQSVGKVSGEPLINNERKVLSSSGLQNLPTEKFTENKKSSHEERLKNLIKWIFLGT